MKSGLYRGLAILAACFATPWAAWHQKRICRKGRVLTNQELTLAKALDLRSQRQIFVQVVERVPNPLYPFFSLASRWGAACISDVEGITLGRGIYIKECSADSLELIAHELVHVGQYQRAGSIWAFMVEYLHQCLMNGYFDAEWEVEARQGSVKELRNC